jgi:type I site-specific restriction endonuclease
MSGEQENLRELLKIYSSRLKILKEFQSISRNMTEEIENKGGEAIEFIDNIAEKREVLLDKIKDADMTARYCESLLSEKLKKALKEIRSAAKNNVPPAFKQEWTQYLFKIFTECEAVVKNIKATDEKNAAAIKALMEIMKNKINAVKENKKMMDKFADGFDMPSVGLLIKEKK